jgi:hypothetical protein
MPVPDTQAQPASKIPPPPPGFTPEQAPAAAPPPPPGFTPETAQPAAKPEQPGFWQRLGESIGLPTSAELEQHGHAVQEHPIQSAIEADPTVSAAKGLYGYGKRVLTGSGEASKEVGEAARNIKEGGPVLPNIGKAGYAEVNNAVGALPFVGEPAQKVGQDVSEGNYKGAAGGATGIAAQVVAPELIDRAPAGITKVKGVAGTAMRTPEGTLRPGVRATARAAGALAGHASGIPGAEIAGVFAGPSVADALVPNRPGAVTVAERRAAAAAEKAAAKADAAARQPVPLRNSPYYAENQAKAAATAKAETEARQPVPVTQSPYYAQNQAKLAEQSAAAKAATKADAEAREAVPITQSPYYAENQAKAKADAAAREPVPVTQSPYWTQNKAKAAAEAKAAKPMITVPGETSGPRSVGSEGRPATWTNERVMQLAREGNREAIQQAVRRGMELPPNARYVAGDADFSSGAYNPRSVTVFSPDGTPIKSSGRRIQTTPGIQPRESEELGFPGKRGDREAAVDMSPSAPAKPLTHRTEAPGEVANEGKLGPRADDGEIELIGEHSGPRANASGAPGGGGLEEQARAASEKAQGVKYFREKPGGVREPLIGLGRQDLKAGPGQRIIKVEANGVETVLDEQRIRPQAARPFRRKPE